ncbi:serine hydrolase [Actinopolymorpha pittospori]
MSRLRNVVGKLAIAVTVVATFGASAPLTADASTSVDNAVTVRAEVPTPSLPAARGETSMRELEAIVQPLIDDAAAKGVRVSVAITDQSKPGKKKQSLHLGSTEPYNPASIIKLALLTTLMRQVDRGIISLDAPVTVSPYMVVGGSGTLQDETMPYDTTVRELARRMVVVSDNTATNVLLYYVGVPTVRKLLDDLGLKVMKFNRQMFPGSLITDPPNVTDAADMLSLLDDIYAGKVVSGKSRDQIISWMRAQEVNTKFGAVLDGEPIAHKTGESGNVTHDVGYFLLPHHEITIVVLTEVTTTTDFDTAQEIGNPIVQRIGLEVYNHLGP